MAPMDRDRGRRTGRRLVAALAVGAVLAGCGGGGGREASAPRTRLWIVGSGAPGPVEIPLAGPARLHIDGLPYGWERAAGDVPPSDAATSRLPTAPGQPVAVFVPGPSGVAPWPDAAVSFMAVPVAAGGPFAAGLLDEPLVTVHRRPMHVLRGPGGRPLAHQGVPYGAALVESHGYYVVMGWIGVDRTAIETALATTDVVTD